MIFAPLLTLHTLQCKLNGVNIALSIKSVMDTTIEHVKVQRIKQMDAHVVQGIDGTTCLSRLESKQISFRP